VDNSDKPSPVLIWLRECAARELIDRAAAAARGLGLGRRRTPIGRLAPCEDRIRVIKDTGLPPPPALPGRDLVRICLDQTGEPVRRVLEVLTPLAYFTPGSATRNGRPSPNNACARANSPPGFQPRMLVSRPTQRTVNIGGSRLSD